MAVGVDVVVDTLPDPALGIDALALLERLVRAGRIDFVGGLAVEPVVGAAEAETLGGDHTDMVGGERLAKQAGIEGLDRFVGHRLQAAVALVIDLLGDGQALLDLFQVGHQRHLHLVDDRRIVGEELGMDDLAIVFQAQSLGKAVLRDAGPDDVALAHVPDAFGTVDHVVDLALQDRFEIALHLAAGHFDPDRQRHRGAGLDGVDIGADDFDLAIVDLVEIDRGDELEARRDVAAELDMHVALADALALERRAIGNRDRNLVDLDLAAADLERPFDHRLVGDVGNHVLVGADAGRQDLRDVGVGDDREAVVDRAGGRRVFFVIDFAKGQDEGEDAILVVLQVGLEIAGLDTAE